MPLFDMSVSLKTNISMELKYLWNWMLHIISSIYNQMIPSTRRFQLSTEIKESVSKRTGPVPREPKFVSDCSLQFQWFRTVEHLAMFMQHRHDNPLPRKSWIKFRATLFPGPEFVRGVVGGGSRSWRDSDCDFDYGLCKLSGSWP